ncbi:tRNA (adenosine(37)-N6)-threonylcarbamoyltransferase complex dimerization subunit type 1 TsaB [Lysinibacillus fusiformis]|uniref:tRNA (adenosine(37)-N6)-threonylcarbamoyltransferase complex dimerization subunit type 1 TsaB n=1 Tax=Lysinibacillus fusiformis TaxID=28031 RepID=UPI000D3C7A8D|nr:MULTISPECIES: tRNA (adenosine(37)-N6)-threonylcarbamoyltransferase complex dimerization subunit type 1 TsaB [Lysinibacillus]MED4670099.1 tRNA (adenosine(37)-N6)-threonylcarbamoyltransferase complex dimerization subunit type 1 TsaB [Lysinibacillus fusiformis]QAS57620.1 tRNA (adenosine(37)-N6)-threonylcarbamoyltransferase complex dimerization subunit type 1 TsaB [Lysinibacillus sphaericus]RDV30015.1 tRNA (adenosine(37)-N6)-threonylcarbamoyltransferase complex dimerization subunit type 1 TsaB [L
MIWLGIETANTPLSIAVVKDGKVVAEMVQNIKLTHSAGAMPAIEEILARIDVKPNDLDAIAVSEGPGSYTGVRIGVTLAKTLAWTLQKPLVGISSLKTLAANAALYNGLICPIFDARRGNVYTAVYQGETLEALVEDHHAHIDDLLVRLKALEQPILFVGTDVDIFWENIVQILGDHAVRAPFSIDLPRAMEVIHLAMKMELQSVEATHHFVPQYKRIAEAEANWLKEQKEKEHE